MKYLPILFLTFIASVSACGDEEYKLKPYAEHINEKYSDKNLDIYQILVPKKADQYLLTSLQVEVPKVLIARLEFEEWHKNKKFYVSYLMLDPKYKEETLVQLMYSTTEDGGMLLCGEYVDHKLTSLLKLKGKN